MTNAIFQRIYEQNQINLISDADKAFRATHFDVQNALADLFVHFDVEDCSSSVLTKIFQVISKILQNCRAQDAYHLLQACTQTLSQPRYLQLILRCLQNDERYADAVAQKSYHHENGFYKIVLHDALEYKLRLHVWEPTDEKTPAENAHDHRWDFASSMIVGKYDMDLLSACDMREASPHSEVAHAYTYERNRPGAYDLVEKGPVALYNTTSVSIPAGATYCMDKRVIHRIRYDRSQTTATLMLTARTSQNTCNLYSRAPIANDKTHETPNMARLDVKRCASLLHAAM